MNLFPFALAEEAAETVEEAVETLEAAAETAEEAAEAAKTWLQTAFGDLAEMPWWDWLLLALLLVGGIVAFRHMKGSKKSAWSTRMLALGAICLALSSVLSMIKIFEAPFGGSITAVSMLPLILFAYAYGVGPGLTFGVTYGVLQCILDPKVIGLWQFLLDYPVAFGMIGLAGLFHHSKNDSVGLIAGSVVACVARWLAAVASGVAFYSDYAEGTGMSPLVYSITYNGAYMLPECIVTAVVAALVGARLIRELRKVK